MNIKKAAFLLLIERVFSSVQSSACTDGMTTFAIKVHAYVQEDIQAAMLTIAKEAGGLAVLQNELIANNGNDANFEAVKLYFATVFEELNAMLFPLKVQVDLVLNPQEMKAIDYTGSYDQSCELTNTVQTRTTDAMVKLTEKDPTSVGLHLFIYGCPTNQSRWSSFHIEKKGLCGRAMGVMYTGADSTKASIKSAILNSIQIMGAGSSGAPPVGGIGGKLVSSLQDAATIAAFRNNICSYAMKCISLAPSNFGQILSEVTMITFSNQNLASDSNVGDAFSGVSLP